MNFQILAQFFARRFHKHEGFATLEDVQIIANDPVTHTHPDPKIFQLYGPSQTFVVGAVDANNNLNFNKMIRAGYFGSASMQMLIDTSEFVHMSSDTGQNRGRLTIGNNAGNYWEGYLKFNDMVTFHTDAVFNAMAGAGLLTGTDGPVGSVNMRMANGTLSIENRWANNGWIGWCLQAIVP